MSAMRKHRGNIEIDERERSLNAYQHRHAHNYFVLGARRAEDGAVEDARRLLLQSLSYDPSQASALQALAQLELAQNCPAQARAYAERLLALCPADADVHALLGNIALCEQRPEQALLAFAHAEALGGEAPELRYNTGLAHLSLGHGESAARIFLAVIDEQPTNARAWDALGCARRFLRDHAGALQAFMQALQHDPRLNDARDHLAQLLLDTGNVPRARQILEAALSLEPHRPGSLHLLGMAFARLQDVPHAIACWEELLAHGGAPSDTYHLLANAYLHMDDEARARQTLETLVTRFPEQAPGHIQLALLLFRNGQLDNGHRHLALAKLLDPENPTLQQAFLAAERLAAQQSPPLGE